MYSRVTRVIGAGARRLVATLQRTQGCDCNWSVGAAFQTPYVPDRICSFYEQSRQRGRELVCCDELAAAQQRYGASHVPNPVRQCDGAGHGTWGLESKLRAMRRRPLRAGRRPLSAACPPFGRPPARLARHLPKLRRRSACARCSTRTGACRASACPCPRALFNARGRAPRLRPAGRRVCARACPGVPLGRLTRTTDTAQVPRD